MRIRIAVTAGCLCLALGASAQQPTPPPPPAKGALPPGADAAALPIAGAYAVEGGTWLVRVIRLTPDMFWLDASEGWEGVGFLDGVTYRGVFRERITRDHPTGARGDLTVDWSDLRNPSMTARYTKARTGQVAQRWHRLSDSLAVPMKPDVKPKKPDIVVAPPAPGPGHRPEFGEYVYVEELPEAIKKVAPVYPNVQERVNDVVLVQALVLEDGSVGDVRIVKSVPMLDEAAIACVRQWRFKPALTGGKPVAVWVAVPIRFGNP
jgi:protein TonB